MPCLILSIIPLQAKDETKEYILLMERQLQYLEFVGTELPLLFWDMVSMCNRLGCVGINFVYQAGLGLTQIHLYHLSDRIKGVCHHNLL